MLEANCSVSCFAEEVRDGGRESSCICAMLLPPPPVWPSAEEKLLPCRASPLPLLLALSLKLLGGGGGSVGGEGKGEDGCVFMNFVKSSDFFLRLGHASLNLLVGCGDGGGGGSLCTPSSGCRTVLSAWPMASVVGRAGGDSRRAESKRRGEDDGLERGELAVGAW